MTRTHLHMRRAPTYVPPERSLVARCQKIVAQMGAYMEVIGQRDARKSGTTKGAPDAILYASGRCLPVEFKSDDGRMEPEQLACMAARYAQHVETHVIRRPIEMIELLNAARRGEV